VPQIAGVVFWVQSGVIGFWDVIEDAAVVVWNLLTQIIDLIPTSLGSSLGKAGYSTASTSVAETIIRTRAATPTAQAMNLSDILGFGFILDVLQVRTSALWQLDLSLPILDCLEG
jgi:hypothetical protein